MPTQFPILLALAASWLLAAQPSIAAPYELGLGYPIGHSSFTASGYASLRADHLDGDKSKLDLQDISLLLHGDINPLWHAFTEIELSNALIVSRDGLKTTDADLDFERLYLDHNLAARTTLRVGKFLTPIGRWNQIHADPLVWTVSRPLTTSAAFARHATGVQLFGSWPWEEAAIDFHAYLDDSSQLDPSEGQEATFLDLNLHPNPPSSFRRGGGLRAAYRNFDDSLQVGLSAAQYTLKELRGDKRLFGSDLFWTRNALELTGEAIYRQNTRHQADPEWGAFLQLAVPIDGSFYAIASHERYHAALFPTPVNSTSLGLTYRPRPPLSIKLEHRDSWGEKRLAPPGWLCSIAVLM